MGRCGGAEKFHLRSLDCCLPMGLSGKELRAGEQGQTLAPVAVPVPVPVSGLVAAWPRASHFISQFLHLQSEDQSPQSRDEKTLVRAVERFLPAGHPGHSADASAVRPWSVLTAIEGGWGFLQSGALRGLPRTVGSGRWSG